MTQHGRTIPMDTKNRIVSALCVYAVYMCVTVLLLLVNTSPATSADAAQETLEGIRAFSVAVEDLKPDVQKYAPRFGLTKTQLRKDIEQWLEDAGITVRMGNGATDTSILYLSVNTVNYQKYWYSYTVSLQAKQIPASNIAADFKSFPDIWSVDISGTANIGTLNSVKDNVRALVGKFISAYESANGKERKQK